MVQSMRVLWTFNFPKAAILQILLVNHFITGTTPRTIIVIAIIDDGTGEKEELVS